MGPDTWHEAEDFFERGLSAGTTEREALLRAAAPDVALLVRQLWRQHGEAGLFLERPAVALPRPGQFADGRVLAGRFRVVGFMGAGGMGEVYRAHDQQLGRTVAIKALRPEMVADPEWRSRFDREARAVCSLNHPRICALHDVAWEGETPLLIMECLSGESMSDRLARGKMPFPELLRVAEGLADALAYAHGQGVVHRDLKPGNIMLTEYGPKLLDFGVAKRVIVNASDDTVTQTMAGAIVGSAAYMSPEQAQGRDTDHRSDMFSFGAVLYEMATGRRAFEGDTPMSTVAAVLEREAPPMRDLAPAIPPALDRLVQRCLRKHREQRYPDMIEVVSAIQTLTKSHFRWGWVVAAGCVAMMIAAVTAVFAVRRATTAGAVELPKPVQLTADLGITTDPSLSADGKWLVYASDRGETGAYGLWVQRLNGTDARRLTECRDVGNPTFTPDGEHIIYSCAENPFKQDVYSIPSNGGQPRLIAKDAYWPTISPDGKYIALLSPTSNRFSVQKLAGGPRVPVGPDYTISTKAVWSSDSTRLLFFNRYYALIVPIDGSEAIQVPSITAFLEQRFQYVGALAAPIPFAWTETHLYLGLQSPGSRDVWRVPFDGARGVTTGAPVRITTGLNARNGTVQLGKLLFDVMDVQSNLFAFQLTSDGKTVAAAPGQLTFESRENGFPSVSRNGRKAAYVSLRSQGPELLVIDLASRASSVIAKLPNIRTDFSVPLSDDGAQVAWSEQADIYRSRVDDPERELVCRDCGVPRAWLPDGSGLLITEHPQEMNKVLQFDFATRKHTIVLPSEDHADVLAVRSLSPDGAWITVLRLRHAVPELFIAPLPQARNHNSEWIPLKPGLLDCVWSDHDDLLYATDGTALLAIPLNNRTKYPSGPPIPVYALSKGQRQGFWLISVGKEVIVAPISKTQSNIWMQDVRRALLTF